MRKYFALTCLIFLALALTLKSYRQANANSDGDEFLLQVVKYLSSRNLEGRKSGSLGSRFSANFIAKNLLDFGIKPISPISRDNPKDYFSFFLVRGKDKNGEKREFRTGKNLIGYWAPPRTSFDKGYILLSAHYDHLGKMRKDDGSWETFPGANDNASGVATLLALARRLSLDNSSEEINFPIVFLFSDMEEEGLEGARAFLKNSSGILIYSHPLMVVNLDTIGAPVNDTLYIASGADINTKNQGTKRMLSMIEELVRQSNSPITVQNMEHGWEAGDHFVFHEAQIPFVFLFGGAPLTYHRPTDTWEKVEYLFLVKVSNLLFNLLKAIPEDASFTFRPLSPSATAPAGNGKRRAFLGTIPDFSNVVKGGVIISGVVPGSPAERAGLKANDIIRKLAGKEVTDLKTYSELLKDLSPGDSVHIVFERDGVLQEVVVTLEERPLNSK